MIKMIKLNLREATTQAFINVRTFGNKIYQKVIFPYSKLLAGLAGFFFVLILAISKMYNYDQGTDVGLDADWFMALAYTWQHGQIIGRDIFFTYGPLTQVITYLFTLFNVTGSVFNSFALAFWGLMVVSLVSFCLAIALIKQIGWKYTLFLFLAFTILGLIEESFSYRVWLPVVFAIGLAHTMARSAATRRLIWSGLTGLGIVLLQLFSSDTGIYSITASLITLLSFTLLAFFSRVLKITGLLRARSYLYMALCLAGGFTAGNLLVSLFFTLSSSNYGGFFDYQSTTIELIRGYNNTFGTEWLLPWTTTIIFTLVLIYTIWFVVIHLTRLKTEQAYLLSSLLVVGVFQLKSAIVRSADTGHFLLACQPLVFLFLLLGYDWLETGTQKFAWLEIVKRKFVWLGLVVLLVVSLPSTGLQSFEQLAQIAGGKISLSLKLKDSLTHQVPQANIVPAGLLEATDPSKDVLIFPYEYHIGIGLNKKIVNPSIQAYIAHTTLLQEKYVEDLDHQKGQFEVVYGIDKFVSLPIDSVDNITRSPVIFDYIYHNFRLKTPELYGKGFMLLTPTPTRSDLQNTSLPFTSSGSVGTSLRYKLNQAVSCSLLRLTTRVTYPIFSLIGRPNQFNIRVSWGSTVLKKTGVLALKTAEEFSTYVQLFDNNKLLKVFGNEPVQKTKIDNLLISPKPTGLFEVNPSSFELSKIECVNFDR